MHICVSERESEDSHCESINYLTEYLAIWTRGDAEYWVNLFTNGIIPFKLIFLFNEEANKINF